MHKAIYRRKYKGNSLDVNSIFDENLSIKNNVKKETIKSINWVEKTLNYQYQNLQIHLKKKLDEKKLEELTETFPKFYLHTLEKIRRGE